MIRKLYSLALLSCCLFFFAGCEDNDEAVDPSSSEPVIKFAYETLEADMNKADNLPVVAVIQSQAGLHNVVMQIQKNDNTLIEYKTVSEFFNAKSYSLSEKLNYESDYKAFIVKAIDKLDREVSQTLPLSIIGLKEAPQLVFTPASIEYNEMIGGVMPRTHFEVTSNAGLKRLEMTLVTASGQEQYGQPIDFDANTLTYTFDELINYKEGDKGFKVTVTDVYGQVKIVTLPVKYITAAPPVITVAKDTIMADKDEKKAVSINIESEAGATKVEIFRIEGQNSSKVVSLDYPEKPTTLDIAPEVTFTNATSKLKIVATDNAGKSTEKIITAIVNMQYVASLSMGSQKFANGNSQVPDVYAMISLKDMASYSLDYALESKTNSANVDLKFYVFGSSAQLRMYTIDGGTGTKSNEFSNGKGKSILDMEVQNATRLLKLSNFDFDNATAETIASSISASNITNTGINPFVVGDVIAFKTGATSSSGGNRIGVMKILSDTQAVSSDVTARVIKVAIKFPKQ